MNDAKDMSDGQAVPVLCRICPHGCGLMADVKNGRVLRMRGDPDNPVYRGFICVKGRAQAEFLSHPDRLRHSLKRQADGSYNRIPLSDALDEIAERLLAIRDRHGPRAIATFMGTYVITNMLNPFLQRAFADAIGTPMRFFAKTIDKPGKEIARAKIGRWMAPPQNFDRPDVGLLIGVNSFVSFQGLPMGNPAKWLQQASAGGFRLIVIDPRRTDMAQRAWLHLQPRPGHDIALLAAMMRVMLDEGQVDQDFLDAHAAGIDQLHMAVRAFDPAAVAQAADVPLDDLLRAARTFGGAKRGYAMSGTGPNMAGWGTLAEYLTHGIDLLAGHVLREGERIANPLVLLPPQRPRAQAEAPKPAYGFGERLRVRGLGNTAAGLPTAAMAEEMLMDGPERVRALISVTGNPAAVVPDHDRTVRALRGLDLLVQVDPWMAQTARIADYVIAPFMPLEMPGTSYFSDQQSAGSHGYGTERPYAQYSPAIAAPPVGAELIEEWRFYTEIAHRMGLAMELPFQSGPFRLEVGSPVPDTDMLIAAATAGSRIPLDAVKRHPHGAFFEQETVIVAPADPDADDRLMLGDPDMMRDLEQMAASYTGSETAPGEETYPFRLTCRRVMHMLNSAVNITATNRGRPINPAFLHPLDMAALDIVPDEEIIVSSARGAIRSIARPDATLRRAMVSMTHGYGGVAGVAGEDWRELGSNVCRLMGVDELFDPYSGQPRMSNVPVAVNKASAPLDAKTANSASLE